MKHLLTILFLFTLTSLPAQSNRIIGVWITTDKSAKIEIVQREKNFRGTMIWLEMDQDEQGKPLTDTQNPDPSKRSRLLHGLEDSQPLQCLPNKANTRVHSLTETNR
jgi:hypothetical protein